MSNPAGSSDSNLAFCNSTSLLNAINTGLIVLNKGLNVVQWNRWIANTSGISSENACHKNFLEIFPELENSRIHQAILANFELGMPAVISNVFNYSPLPLYTNANNLSEEKTPLLQHIQITQISTETQVPKEATETFCLIHVSDVTASAMREKLLEKHINDRKLAEEGMREARQLAEMANYAKSQFLSNISHELRTPLNGIMGMVELLKDCPLDDEALSYIEPLEESSHSLLRLINDLLDYSKIDSDSLSLKSVSFDFNEFINDIDKFSRAKVTEKQLAFELSIPSGMPQEVIGDKGRLRQILIHLLDNAVKFTAEGIISLNIEELDKTASEICLRITVKDTGIGISKENQSAIFDSFSQADVSSTRKYNGTGLGLALCKQLVDLMGGKLIVNSELGAGSIFSFHITLKIAP